MNTFSRLIQLWFTVALLSAVVACSSSPVRPYSSFYSDTASYVNWHCYSDQNGVNESHEIKFSRWYGHGLTVQ